MKLTKDINYSIVIFFSIFLIFIDAYQFYSIPVLDWNEFVISYFSIRIQRSL